MARQPSRDQRESRRRDASWPISAHACLVAPGWLPVNATASRWVLIRPGLAGGQQCVIAVSDCARCRLIQGTVHVSVDEAIEMRERTPTFLRILPAAAAEPA
jgi:hypothetical protein